MLLVFALMVYEPLGTVSVSHDSDRPFTGPQPKPMRDPCWFQDATVWPEEFVTHMST